MRGIVGSICGALMFGAVSIAHAQQLPGVSDTEIRIGNINPYTGPAAAWSDLGRTFTAYFQMINDLGGINGRLVNFISYDDAFSPPRTIEQARRLVERDDVLLIFQPLGAQTNLAIRDYMNEMAVPQLFMANGLSQFDDPDNFPWSMRWNPNFASEARLFAEHINQTFSAGTVGVLYQNDETGQEFLGTFVDQLDDRFEVVSQPYNVTDPSIDAQVAALQSEGAEIFLNVAITRFATQAIRRAAELQWTPYHLIWSISSGIDEVFEPAGIENAVGIVSSRYLKDVADPSVAGDRDVREFQWFWNNYYLGTGKPGFEVYAFAVAAALVEVLRRCGDNLSRENVMLQASSLTNLELPLLLPGITVNTSPSDYSPIEQFRLSRFDGTTFVNFGPLINTADD